MNSQITKKNSKPDFAVYPYYAAVKSSCTNETPYCANVKSHCADEPCNCGNVNSY